MERERKNIPWREKIKYQKLRESSKQENEKIAQLSYVDSLRWSSSTAFFLFSHSTNYVFSFLFCLVRARRDLRDAVASLLYPHRRYFYRISLPFIFIFFLFYTLENYFSSYSLLTWLFTCILKKNIFFIFLYLQFISYAFILFSCVDIKNNF
jgi:hypothetical protein